MSATSDRALEILRTAHKLLTLGGESLDTRAIARALVIHEVEADVMQAITEAMEKHLVLTRAPTTKAALAKLFCKER